MQIGIEVVDYEKIMISTYETKGKKRGLGKTKHAFPLDSSIDDLAAALEKIIAEESAQQNK